MSSGICTVSSTATFQSLHSLQRWPIFPNKLIAEVIFQYSVTLRNKIFIGPRISTEFVIGELTTEEWCGGSFEFPWSLSEDSTFVSFFLLNRKNCYRTRSYHRGRATKRRKGLREWFKWTRRTEEDGEHRLAPQRHRIGRAWRKYARHIALANGASNPIGIAVERVRPCKSVPPIRANFTTVPPEVLSCRWSTHDLLEFATWYELYFWRVASNIGEVYILYTYRWYDKNKCFMYFII